MEKEEPSMEMTSKDRWLAAINFNPIDRLPFWPKFDDAYINGYSSFFDSSDLYDMHKWVGSDQHIWLPSFIIEEVKEGSVNISVDGSIRKTEYVSKSGSALMVEKFDKPSQSWHPTEHPIKNEEDIKILTEIYDNTIIELDKEKLAEIKDYVNEIGEDAVFAAIAGVSPLMYYIQMLASIQDSHMMLFDSEDKVIELLESMHDVMLKKMEVICQYNPGEFIYLLENTSTTLVSPDQYRKYNLKHICEYGDIIKGSDNYYILHMCGLLKNLLPDLNKTNAVAFEAFTSHPVGDTDLIDGRKECPDKCLVGGTNAYLWTKPADKIIETIEKELEKLPSHRGIVITSAGVMPPVTKPETIKEVCDWLKGYKVRL